MGDLKITSSSIQYIVLAAQLLLASSNRSSSQGPEGPLPFNSKTYTQLTSGEECARECVDNAPPKTCYFHFTLESYPVRGGACQNESTDGQCVQADGVERTFLSTNRQLPGPSIEVCEGDQVVIDVRNKIPGQEVTIHWHGIHQRGTQYYDGVPFVTQCPIPEGTTFRYRWYANPGTHFWHSHSGLQKFDGLHGALIVRQSPSRDFHRNLYDVDTIVIEVSDWLHECAISRFPGRYTNMTGGMTNQVPDSLLINGLGVFTDPESGVSTNVSRAVFEVQSGQRYRIRLITSTASVCHVQFAIEGHNMTVIAADGEDVQPYVVNTIVVSSGERYDVIVVTDKPAGAYWIQARGLGECQEKQLQQLAVLQYTDEGAADPSPPPTYEEGLPLGKVLNSLTAPCDGSDPNRICFSELKNAYPVDQGLLKPTADVIIVLPFRFHVYELPDLFRDGSYDTFLVNDQFHVVSLINEVSYGMPSAPLISQRKDVPPEQICNFGKRPPRCDNGTQPCTCTHIIKVPLNAIVEVVLMDYVPVPLLSHPFHLHGYAYSVVGMGRFPSDNVTMEDMMNVINMNRTLLLELEDNRPPSKDTLAVPTGGYTIVRFRADNPGPWFFHCHFLYHIVIDMNFVIDVGKKHHLPPVPRRFPRCENFLPPIYAPYSK